MQNNIVVIGSINQDIIMKVSRMPKLGESMVVDECIVIVRLYIYKDITAYNNEKSSHTY